MQDRGEPSGGRGETLTAHRHRRVAIDREGDIELFDLGAGFVVVSVPAVGLAQRVAGKVVHPLGLIFIVSGKPVCLQVGVVLGR